MNELVQRLKLQAGINDNPDQEGLDLFAQLIVRECIDSVENTNDRHRKDYFANKIRQHFGVEPDVNETLRNRSTYFGNDI